MTARTDQKEVKQRIASYLEMFGPSPMSLVLQGPSLKEVVAAIEAGPRTVLEIRIAKSILFKDVQEVELNRATIRSTMVFETLPLTHIAKLWTIDDPTFYVFSGVQRRYDNRRRADGGRAYTQDEFKITFDSEAAIPFSYTDGVSTPGVDHDKDVWNI